MQAKRLWSAWQALLLSCALGFTRVGQARFVQWSTALTLNVEEHTITQSLIAIDRPDDWKALESFAEYGSWDLAAVQNATAQAAAPADEQLFFGFCVWAGDDTKVHRSSPDVWGTCTFHDYSARTPNRAKTVRGVGGMEGGGHLLRSFAGGGWNQGPEAAVGLGGVPGVDAAADRADDAGPVDEPDVPACAPGGIGAGGRGLVVAAPAVESRQGEGERTGCATPVQAARRGNKSVSGRLAATTHQSRAIPRPRWVENDSAGSPIKPEQPGTEEISGVPALRDASLAQTRCLLLPFSYFSYRGKLLLFDYAGKPVPCATLQAGDRACQNTFLTHPCAEKGAKEVAPRRKAALYRSSNCFIPRGIAGTHLRSSWHLMRTLSP